MLLWRRSHSTVSAVVLHKFIAPFHFPRKRVELEETEDVVFIGLSFCPGCLGVPRTVWLLQISDQFPKIENPAVANSKLGQLSIDYGIFHACILNFPAR